MESLTQEILRTDISGMPLEWIDYRDAVRLYHTEQVAYACGDRLFLLRGGINSVTRAQSRLEIHSIIATYGVHHALNKQQQDYAPPLSNRTLFQRDNHLCLYCGERFGHRDLSRDHVTPLSQGGSNRWTNVVSACVRCNNHKAGRTPEEADMQLLAIPFTPTHAEFVYLQGRNVLADQMAFLRAQLPRQRRG